MRAKNVHQATGRVGPLNGRSASEDDGEEPAADAADADGAADAADAAELVVLVGGSAEVLRRACNWLHKPPGDVVLEALIDYCERNGVPL